MKKVSCGLTPVQEQQLGEIEGHIQCVFQEKAAQWARSTGVVQRSSKRTGPAFAQMHVFGFLNQPEASSTDVQHMMELQGIHVSPQAIEERMTPQAAVLMRHVLEDMVALVVSGQECHLPGLHAFNGVYLPTRRDHCDLARCSARSVAWFGGNGRGSRTPCATANQLEHRETHWSLAARCPRQ